MLVPEIYCNKLTLRYAVQECAVLKLKIWNN